MSWHPHRSMLLLRVRSLANRAGESLLIVPCFMVAGAVSLALTLSWVDRHLPPGALPTFLRLSPEATVQLLSTIAGATITTVGVVFSLIVVSMQLAGGQFSPRVLHTFFRDRLGKVVVGLLSSLFTYCVLALKALPEDLAHRPARVPHLTADAAVLLTLVSVLSLVVYLHRIARRQYVGGIIASITEETLGRVEELCRAGRAHPPAEAPDLAALGPPLVIPATKDGWVQAVSPTGLLAAVPPGSVVRLETRVGAFLVRGIPLATIWPRPPRGEATVARVLQAAVVVGDRRTHQQDVDFGLRQLSDIALRSLSPAVNDPTTAIEVVLRMASILRPLLLAPLPPQVIGMHGSVLLRPWDLDHAEYVRHAFEQLRVYAAPHPQVAIALVRSLRMLWEALEGTDAAEARQELEKQLTLTLEGCERADMLPTDLESVREAATHAQNPVRRFHHEPELPHVH